MSGPLEEAVTTYAEVFLRPGLSGGHMPALRAAIQAYLRTRADTDGDLYLVMHEIELLKMLAAELDQPAETAGKHE